MEKLPGRSSAATHELIFKANDIPPLGFKSFYVTREKNVERAVTFQKIDKKPFVLHVPHQVFESTITLTYLKKMRFTFCIRKIVRCRTQK